jgi:hypothetical protein
MRTYIPAILGAYRLYNNLFRKENNKVYNPLQLPQKPSVCSGGTIN